VDSLAVAQSHTITGPAAIVQVTVRYFGAARAAAGTETETFETRAGTTLAELLERLGYRSADMARVLQRCSFLCNGVAVRDRHAQQIATSQTVDVLPPFAGG
jgi:molybdopterin synthase sulfur carrier subunit